MQIFLTTFITIFLAELGDKTQIATLLFSSTGNHSKWIIFIAASLALMSTSALAVIFGNTISNYIDPKMLKTIGGIGFIIVGIWTLATK